MPTVSQTRTGISGRFALRMVIVMAAVLGIVALAVAPHAGGVAHMAVAARFHAPDLQLLSHLSPVIRIHLYVALAAIVLGAALMIVRKGKTSHRVAGWVWVSMVAVVAGSSLFITSLNHGRWSLLHLITGWTLLILPLAVIFARRHNVARHRRAMMGLFYGGFAFNLAIAFIPGRTLWAVFFG